ncbi:flavin-containing monooxygenase FMO GS-OX5-like [Cynara cardunculus var. scolymus]|uniref:flavin-containing monooxygenase FMO GS-OX5-like n=1 Tax=Cynara cardunculus var. scolymus TaxID=59895 RepID=UPI000D62DC6C|nr:flavin-containing monooxygenase FMO GS-OX5-like [Cynara cardunculus var. scolymus]
MLKVAVVGAGLSGLIVARELQRESHEVVVLEKSHRLGGVWVYDPRIESDLLGFDPDREIVHATIYKSLRTNSPRQIMGFSDYAFQGKEYGDPRMFPGHQELLRYLEDFAETFGVTKLIRFNSEVIRVESLSPGNEFVVESKKSGLSLGSSSTLTEIFDAVVICNGHNTQPRVAVDIPGILEWSRKQLHAHNYRVPEPYRDQVVVIIGNGSSAYDISREIAVVAKEVHLSSRSPNVKVSKLDKYNNIWQHSKIDRVFKDGTIQFQDHVSITADTIIHCTGYEFHIPFLKTNGIVSINDSRVRPIYGHVFPPQLAPRLSFVGLFNMGMTFLPAELQSKWIARALSGTISLPSEKEMLHNIEHFYRQMEERGIPKRNTHSLNHNMDYLDWLSDQLGITRPPQSLKVFYARFIKHFHSDHEGFRETFEDNCLINDEI